MRAPCAPVCLSPDVLADRPAHPAASAAKRIDHRRQLLVFHFDEFRGIGGDIAVVGDDEGHFLILEADLFVRQHRLHVAGQRRHPMQFERLQIVGGEDRMHTGMGQCPRLVDLLDARMRIRTAHHHAEQHSRHLDVVDVGAFALNEARILAAFAGATHAFERGETVEIGVEIAHDVSPGRQCASAVISGCDVSTASPRSLRAAYWTALTMF